MWAKLGLKMAKGFIVSKILGPDFQEAITRQINAKVDLPGLDEEQERKLIRAIVGATAECITNL